jgi:hypothetical protein
MMKLAAVTTGYTAFHAVVPRILSGLLLGLSKQPQLLPGQNPNNKLCSACGRLFMADMPNLEKEFEKHVRRDHGLKREDTTKTTHDDLKSES